MSIEEDKYIIYLALGNQVQLYGQLLEDKDLSQEDKDMSEYIITRSLEIMDKYAQDIEKEHISKPRWDQIKLQ